MVLAHHPFDQSPDTGKALMRHARRTIEALADCEAHPILSGHLHRWLAEPFVERRGGTRVLQVHVGTGLSTRDRGQGNDFAVLDLTRNRIDVTRMQAQHGSFRPTERHGFARRCGGWRPLSAPPGPGAG